MGNLPDNILTALKEAVINVFWKKQDVRALFQRCQVPAALINEQDWSRYKYHIVAPVLDALNSRETGQRPLARILDETLKYTDGDHLLWTPDPERRKREAERSLDHLRLLVQSHRAVAEEERRAREDRLRRAAEAKRGSAFQEKLVEIRRRFLDYHQDADVRARGYGLEEILYDLFLLFELEPRGPFRRVGEQIDGAFAHDGDHFLLEAKWQQSPVILADLRDLDGAVISSLDNTLGLFVSLNGFSAEALEGYVLGNRPRLICMDGMDLMSVLEGQIDLTELLRRKRDLAVQKRRIFVGAADILRGAN